jgi:hypothetical protein
MDSEGVCMGLIIGDDISEHSSACHEKSCNIVDNMGSHDARNTNVMGS